MATILAVLSSIGLVSACGFAVAYALTVRALSQLKIDLAASRAETAVAGGELRSARERNLQIGTTLARYQRQVRDLQAQVREMVIYLPRDRADLVLAGLDQLLSPEDASGDPTGPVSGGTDGVADIPDPEGPLPG